LLQLVIVIPFSPFSSPSSFSFRGVMESIMKAVRKGDVKRLAKLMSQDAIE